MRDYRDIVIEQLASRIDGLETALATEKFWRGEVERENKELKKALSATDAADAAKEEN